MKELEEILQRLQTEAFNRGKLYQKQCENGLSGEMSEYHAPAEFYTRQRAMLEIKKLLK